MNEHKYHFDSANEGASRDLPMHEKPQTLEWFEGELDEILGEMDTGDTSALTSEQVLELENLRNEAQELIREAKERYRRIHDEEQGDS